MANTKNLDYMKMFRDIGSVCMTENVCHKCQDKGCFVGYARESISEAKKADTDYIKDGFANIPHIDAKAGYDSEDVYAAIAHTLLQCKSCKECHFDDCLVNIVRGCYEVIAFGDFMEYEGSTLLYLKNLEKIYPNIAAIILEEYKMPRD